MSRTAGPSSRSPTARPKTFRDYQPGYFHLDIKRLPAIADEDRRTYLFVAIDRASRQVYLERHREKSRKVATRFLKNLQEKCPFHLRILLTDNDQALTDRFPKKSRQPSVICLRSGSSRTGSLRTASCSGNKLTISRVFTLQDVKKTVEAMETEVVA
ncbi:Integrase core domain-containing protein [Thiohalospira halophila DSM 15071]|uniref:Integrase core domain-containing protein n=1 Tax=Thiohalospira halophila DSM 15071 TaxID=1123397 RepID=A0A1I1VMG0_9GAMM|nr:Integrase core domain-containing protein [Thiohalospira halophila DSM 15071]